mmetsp:Transcript_35587/g.105508  ORF Transcript_35587/g.105508 Transcript_35587/m.105508 type:complete len:448 (+) Transcript_35587:56-1399(+)
MAASLLASASFAFLHAPIRPAAAQPLRPALFPRLAQPAALLLPEQLPSALVADSLLDSVGGVAAAGVGAVLLIALLAGKGNMASGAALMVLFLGGDPDERDASGANENKLLKEFALSITPSAWKKAYQGEGAEDGEPAALLDLPAWQGEEARELTEPEAVTCVQQMQLAPITVPSVGPVETCYLSLTPEAPAEAPPVMLIHGFDSSLLEFRYLTQPLLDAGLRVEAMEWWSGGFTARAPFTEAISAGKAEPWDLIREHQLAFWKRQLGDTKVTLLGASLGGAVALDFAATHPECVDRLILMDAGGESYAQPDPFLTSLAADPVTNLFQWRATNGLLPYPHVWAKEEGWRQALQAYLRSGGYQNRVSEPLIRTVPQPTLVLWGEEDDVLPVEDAFKYQEHLPDCVRVELIPDAQHAPALENPAYVADAIVRFATAADVREDTRQPQPA